jgi:hypothetical protein
MLHRADDRHTKADSRAVIEVSFDRQEVYAAPAFQRHTLLCCKEAHFLNLSSNNPDQKEIIGTSGAEIQEVACNVVFAESRTILGGDLAVLEVVRHENL